MPRLERNYQPGLIKRIERISSDFIVRKVEIQQGFPDLLILGVEFWALLEVKKEKPTPSDYEPNQEWWIEQLDNMSFSACIYPENEKEVLSALAQAYRTRR